MLSKVDSVLSSHDSLRANELFQQQQHRIHARTDRLFAVLMLLQWVAGMLAAIWISPRTWAGSTSEIHVHVWAAIFLGGAICSVPTALVWLKAGSVLTRHVIAISQMLTAALFIHLTGGRIETHFHIFGSLAFLACYRDWRVLVTATIVVATDHGLRGWLWPESVYGVLSGSSLRFLEHAGWVIFEDIFLCVTIRQSLNDMRLNAHNQAQLESTNTHIEAEVRRRTDELARANQALAAQNEELDQFTYIASHDLQEPVRKLVSFSRLLEQDVGDDLNEDAKRDLGFIVDAAKRMKNLVQALLELSRVGRSAMHRNPVDLNRCVEDAIRALEMRIEETGAEIQCDTLPTVVGDQTMLTQLYQNLISNALKFIENQKPKIHLTANFVDGAWICGVRDNGIGMKPEYAERIFQPFQRLHNRGEYEGTGIGLSICKKNVSRHAGEIWVESQVGQGAHFQFSLPHADSSPAPMTPATTKPTMLLNTTPAPIPTLQSDPVGTASATSPVSSL